MHTCFMKKSILKLIAILTTGCAVCFAGCAKNSDNSSAAPDENKQKITRTDDITPDDDNDNMNKPPRKCPDGNCGRRGPHAGRGRARRIPLGENFTFIIEIDLYLFTYARNFRAPLFWLWTSRLCAYSLNNKKCPSEPFIWLLTGFPFIRLLVRPLR